MLWDELACDVVKSKGSMHSPVANSHLPMNCNFYSYYTLWIDRWREKNTSGKVI